MRTSTLATLFFSGLALAGPVRKRGDDIQTDVIVETIWTTTTIFVDGPTDAAFFEIASSTASATSSSSTEASSSVAVASSAPPPPPSPPAVAQLKAPEIKPVVPAVPVAKPVAAAAAPASGVMQGDATWYDVSVGLGSCGKQKSNSDNTVALSATFMQNGVNPNANPLCGRKIILSYGGVTHEATIDDTCPGNECTAGSVDLAKEFFKKVFPDGDGRVKTGFTWWLA